MDLYYLLHSNQERVFLKNTKAKSRSELMAELGGQFIGIDDDVYLISEVKAMNIFHWKGFFPLIVALICCVQVWYFVGWHFGLFSLALGYVLADYFHINKTIAVNQFNLSTPNHGTILQA